jgi:hypothetical protein
VLSERYRIRGTVLFFIKRTVPFFFFLTACRPPVPSLTPPPRFSAVQGLASLKISRDGRTSKSKFTYALALPNRGRIEVIDPLGRAVLQFLVEGEEAYLVLLSKKVYARGGRSEVLERLLGFPLDLDEIVALLTGRWGGEGENPLTGWTIERDGRGRAAAGRREGFGFAVLDFFPGGGVPRRLAFQGAPSEGTVTLLSLAFDRPVAPLNLGFRDRFRALSWEDIERLLRDEG